MPLRIALLAFALASPAFVSPVLAQTALSGSRTPSITVHGEGRSEAAPDYAAISADVVTTGASLDAATKAHRARATRAADALKALKAKGIEIKSSTFRLNRVTPPTVAGRQPSAPEYRAVTSFSLKTRNIAAIDDITTAIAATGLFELHNVSFALDENTKALDQARRAAVADARARASAYAEAAGVALGNVVEISDTERHVPLMRAAAPMSFDQKVQVVPPETLTAQASVTITWALKEP